MYGSLGIWGKEENAPSVSQYNSLKHHNLLYQNLGTSYVSMVAFKLEVVVSLLINNNMISYCDARLTFKKSPVILLLSLGINTLSFDSLNTQQLSCLVQNPRLTLSSIWTPRGVYKTAHTPRFHTTFQLLSVSAWILWQSISREIWRALRQGCLKLGQLDKSKFSFIRSTYLCPPA